MFLFFINISYAFTLSAGDILVIHADMQKENLDYNFASIDKEDRFIISDSTGSSNGHAAVGLDIEKTMEAYGLGDGNNPQGREDGVYDYEYDWIDRYGNSIWKVYEPKAKKFKEKKQEAADNTWDYWGKPFSILGGLEDTSKFYC